MVLQAIFYGLQDPDDDVRAVAAASLIPVSQQLACIMPDMVSDFYGLIIDSSQLHLPLQCFHALEVF